MAKREKRKQTSQSVARQKRKEIPPYWSYLFIVAAVVVFVYLCLHIDLTQDDAYISFRYAENLLQGEGLVYNSGERVEGYTNFLWVILLALFKGFLSIDYLAASRFLGVAAGCIIFLLIYLLIQHHFEKNQTIYFIAAAVLLLSNMSLPYWSIASLETSAFACMALAALVAEYRRPRMTPVLLVIATLLRPEGGLVFVVILLHRIITERKFPLTYFLLYSIPLLPFAAFKILYYGSLFPNPYYAKSGVGLEYIISGLEYLWHFASTIGIYGLLFLVPLLAVKTLWKRFSLLYLFVAFYLAYIVWVGGDVLKVYRFFVPVVPVLYFLFVVASLELFSRVYNRRSVAINLALLAVILFSIGSHLLSRGHINAYWFAERNIVLKMNFVSTMLKKHMGDDFSAAASTIGKFGYNLVGHRVIDMLGLTDSYIARNPETVEGIESSWKEKRFNTRYLLEQQPDYILFSTGYKPSAPAERALMLHSEFRRNYATIGFFRGKGYKVVFRRQGEIDMSHDVVHSDLRFVEELHQGYNYLVRSEYREAEIHFRKSLEYLGENYAPLYCDVGNCLLRQNELDSARAYYQQAIELDSNCWEARMKLGHLAYLAGDSVTTYYHTKILRENSPWLFDNSNK